MRRDIYKHEEKYLNWKKKISKTEIEGISRENSELVKKYIFDMENGLNVAMKSPKGARSYIRLNDLRQRLCFIIRLLEKDSGMRSIADLKEENLFNIFNGMRTGKIKRIDGKKYKSTHDYVKVFKAFWHWYQKINKKNGIEILDITADLDTSHEKPEWVYLTEEQVKQLCNNAKYEYKVLILFLFDTGIRAPTELLNLRVSDLYNDCKELTIREETSKTFGRKIKLLLCSDILKNYVKEKKLKSDDYLFDINHYVANRYLQRLALKVLGKHKSLAGENYSKLTLYDFRHNSCCYWLPRYKSESALKYRFGWKKSDKINYYSEMLGMKDTISEEDLLIDTTKTEIEKRLNETEKENSILKDKVSFMEKKLEEIQKLTDNLFEKINRS